VGVGDVSRRWTYAGLGLAVIFWGASFVAAKIALRELTPAALTCARFGIGLLVLLGTVLLRRDSRPVPRRDLPLLFLLGLIGVALHQWLQATGLQTAAASVSSWIVTTIPIFVALLGWIFLGERLGRWRALGIGIAGVGTLVVASGGRLAGLVSGQVGTVGDALMAVSALNWAVFTVLSKRVLTSDGETGQEASPLTKTLIMMAFGWLATLPWVALDRGWRGLGSLSIGGWAALLFLGAACSGLAYLFWYDALQLVDATQVGAFLYLEPLVTSLLALPLLGEPLTAALGLGGATILIGVWMVNRA
jgi:drug/metabolite transporter (DMT)-like permease